MALERSITKEMIRMCLLYNFKFRVDAAESSRQIFVTFCTGTVSKSTAQAWFKNFRNDDNNIEDQPHSGRPSQMKEGTIETASGS